MKKSIEYKKIIYALQIYLLYYILGNLSKKILMFSFVAYLLRTFNFRYLLVFLLFYISYLSIYFFNDYIDRKEDIKRKFILSYKLVLSEKILLLLGFLHLTFLILLIMVDVRIALLSSMIILLAVFRSFIKKVTIREITLAILEFIQLYLFFVILNKQQYFLKYLLLTIQFSIFYAFLYYIHKIPEKGKNKFKLIAYFLTIAILSLLSLPEVRDPIIFLYLLISPIISILLYKSFVSSPKLSYSTLKFISVAYYVISIFLLFLVISNYNLHLTTTSFTLIQTLANYNKKIKEILLVFY